MTDCLQNFYIFGNKICRRQKIFGSATSEEGPWRLNLTAGFAKSHFNNDTALHNVAQPQLLKAIHLQISIHRVLMGLKKLLMFCRQIEGYLMSHTGTCACSAVARRWHLVWKVTGGKAMSAAHKQHSTLAWNRLWPSCGFAKCQCLLFCGFALFPNLLLTWNEPFRNQSWDTLTRTLSQDRGCDLSPWAADSLFGLVPSLRSNYTDCHSTMVDTRTHKGLTMEKTNRDARLCPTTDSKESYFICDD